MLTRAFVPVFALALAGSAPAQADLLARMDQAATAFRSMSGSMRSVNHTAVIGTDEVESGTLLVKRVKANDVRMLTQLTEPDEKAVAFQGGKAEMYLPKAQLVQVYDIGKNKDLLAQFFLLGFGTSRAEMTRDFTIEQGGEETVAGRKTIRIGLTPKDQKILQHLKKVELWVAPDTGYAVQQKFHQGGGDYRLVTYTSLEINPQIPDAALKLKLPRGVKREIMGQ
ncbi:MAG: outer membrane lipoprotein carrier protein LolA [Bryobacterales bacterium]|jgi:outer membrane lipoprotein-sorting protein|nr:outer membrane lipoprotein carrier protein LolA [Bryobacterales bacterium]